MFNSFRNTIIEWYVLNKRDLPWRKSGDPYKIWLSEIILQQTRVVQGTPYYYKFIEAFPTIFDLARANEEEVLRLWQGLGYYSRARNLHKCAKVVVENFEGVFPGEYVELIRLPGIGPYTAAAIASIAFKKPKPVVDGNVQRVLSRYFGISDDVSSPRTVKKMFKLSENLIDQEQPDLYNQGIMEFGALHCTPKKPLCKECPLNFTCFAYENGKVEVLPVKLKKVKKKIRHFHYQIFKTGNEIALKRRIKGDIWEGLYDFHLLENSEKYEVTTILEKLNLDSARMTIKGDQWTIKHILTHQNIFAHFLQIEVDQEVKKVLESAGMRFFNHEKVRQLPKPILIDNYLHDEIF